MFEVLASSGPKTPGTLGVALISPPWPLYHRPSIQLGTLKACLRARFPGISTMACHTYLQIAGAVGYSVYQAVSERTWPAEAVYAALLFPEKQNEARRLFQRQASGRPVLKKIDFDWLVATVEKATEDILSGISLENVHLAGISACLCQLSASLYFMRRIKQRSPEIRLVLGGSTFSGLSGEALFRFFPEVDFLVHGEGEGPLGNIVEHLVRYRHGEAPFPAINGVFQRGAPLSKDGIQFDQRSRLGNLPAPDYDDYFALLEGLPPGKRFFPTLPLEMSRGCSWQKAGKGKKEKKGGCAFCNLNLQWRGYRCKDPEQGAEEVAHFCRRHRVLSVAFTDNILPVRLSDRLFGRLASHGKDYHFFCEIRADTPKAVLARMRHAGVKEVQIGIEALSTPLLKRLHKGTTALQNIEIMKHCEHLGVKSISNLILYFPGSDAADVKETLRLLAFVAPFRPLRTVSFWLGRGSAVQENPFDFGITGVRNHPNYRFLFPKTLAGELPLMIQTYRGDRLQQKRLWRPVKERVRQWKKEYARLHEGPDSTPVLAYSDGGTFLIIRQRRAGAPPMNHRLEGLSRKIYLFCDTARSVTEILFYFKELSEDRLAAFLNGMVKKHLMVNEGHRYLSLAVPERKSRFAPSEVEIVKTDR